LHGNTGKFDVNIERNTTAIGGVVEFRSSRSKALLVAGGCATVAAIIGYATLIAQSGWWPWLVVAYFGVGAVMVLMNGLFRPATLRLDADGVHFTHWRYRWSVAWGDLAEVQLATLRINGFTTRQNVVLLDRAGAKHTVSSGLTVTPAKLAYLIRVRNDFG
jgi:hypothetical protein